MITSDRDPQKAMRKNVIDMALGFTATMRVFEERSKGVIAILLLEHLTAAQTATSSTDFEKLHETFCREFVKKIRLAQRKLQSGAIKPASAASYGHAAKMFDVCAKVWFHYCKMPDHQTAQRVTPYLHGAIDTPILRRLKGEFPEHGVEATTIARINEIDYRCLQGLAQRDRMKNYPRASLMVEYDDLVWSDLSRRDAQVKR